MPFKIGEAVRWIRAVPDSFQSKNLVGTIQAVIPHDLDPERFNMYEIEFALGTFKLYGIQLEPAPQVKSFQSGCH